MRPRIRSISANHYEDFETFQPKNPTNFAIEVRVMIGTEQGEGEESFDFSVCTPDWLQAQCDETGYFFAGRRLVVDHWDVSLVRRFLDKRISTIVADSWSELADKISRFSHWEFEDYREISTK